MEFGAPENLVLIWLVPLVVLVCFFAEKIRKNRLRLVGMLRADPLGKESAPTSFFRWLVKTTMLAAAVACLVLAVSKPRWGFEWIDAKQRGADIIIAVDVSKSMLAPDVSPSRLERARRKVSDLLDRMSGDRVGLVAFAGTSFVQCPLTMDYGAVRLFLSYLDPEMIPTQGTDLGSAIDMSLAGLFDGAPEGTTTGRAIIIMTDGEDQEGRGLAAAEAAKSKGVKIYTMSIGSEEGTLIPEPGGGFKKDRSGNLVISKPNEPALKALAFATGGSHVRSVAGDGDIEAIYDNGILKEIDRQENQEIRTKRWHERFQWFLAAAVLLLFLEPLIKDVRSPRKSRAVTAVKGIPALGLIALLGMIVYAPESFAASLSDAHKYYNDKDYEKAAKEFAEVEKNEPENPEVTYNRAVSQFRNGDFQGAAEGFGRSAGSKDKTLQEKSWYNLGNSLSYMQKFKEAVDAYENTLKLNPENVKAKENLELVKKLLEQQKQQKQDQQNQKNNNDEKKEGEEQDAQQDGQPQDGQPQEGQQQDQKQQNGAAQNQQQQNGQENQKDPGEQGDQKQQQEQPGEQKKDGETKGEESQETPTEKKEDTAGEGQEEQQEKKSPEGKSGEEKDESASDQQTIHNQESGNELKQSQTYSKDQAKQLLRTVEDKIKKYRYMEQSGAGQNQDPEKDW